MQIHTLKVQQCNDVAGQGQKQPYLLTGRPVISLPFGKAYNSSPLLSEFIQILQRLIATSLSTLDPIHCSNTGLMSYSGSPLCLQLPVPGQNTCLHTSHSYFLLVVHILHQAHPPPSEGTGPSSGFSHCYSWASFTMCVSTQNVFSYHRNCSLLNIYIHKHTTSYILHHLEGFMFNGNLFLNVLQMNKCLNFT